MFHHDPQHCAPPQPCPSPAPPCPETHCPTTPLPPPIPPVRYVPGMNVQEQLCHMAERVNESIHRWNEIQRNCYEALDQCVGAAVNNDVYYAPDEVCLENGYDENEGVGYALIRLRKVDRKGCPIRLRLNTAYRSVTNSGVIQPISDVSFINSANAVVSATSEALWRGTALIGGKPISSESDENVWVYGFNSYGTLRFFKGNVTHKELCQNQMVDVIGGCIPVVMDSEIFTQAVADLPKTRMAIQAIGQTACGDNFIVSVSIENQPGMTIHECASLMKRLGAKTAVVAASQTGATTKANDPDVPTTGTTFLGKLVTAPLEYKMPESCAFWVCSKRPHGGWGNRFTTEVANVVQMLGSTNDKMDSIQGTLDRIDAGELEKELDQINQQITEINNNITTINLSISDLQKADEEIRQEIQDTEDKLTEQINTEQTQREQEDAALRAALDQEKIDRAQGDQTLQTAVDTLRSDSNAKDAQLQAQINTLKDGSGLPIATTSKVGVIKVGRNLTVTVDGRLDAAETGLMPNDITAGDGIIVDNPAGTETVVISADKTVLATVEQVAAVETKADANTEKINTNTTDIEALKTSQEEQDTKIAANEQAITELGQRVDDELANVNAEIDSIKDGTDLPIASVERLGAIKVGANLTITEDGTLNATGGGDGGGSETVTGGVGISVTREEDIATISLDQDTQAKLREVDNKLDKSVYDTDKSELTSTLNDLRTDINSDGQDIEAIQTEQATQNQDIQALKDKDLTIDGDIAQLREDLTSVDNTATSALNMAADAEMEAKKKVDKAGDVMTGELSTPSIKLPYNTDSSVVISAKLLETEVLEGEREESEIDPGGADQEVTDPELNGEGEMGESEEDNEPEARSVAFKTTPNVDLKTTNATRAGEIEDAVVETSPLVLSIGQMDGTEPPKDVVIEGVADGQAENHAANMGQLNTATQDLRGTVDTKVDKSGDTMSGGLQLPELLVATPGGVVIGKLTGGISGNTPILTLTGINDTGTSAAILRGVSAPSALNDATNKKYVDDADAAIRTTAENASSTASQASTAASEALTKATAAQNTANAAQTTANNALPKSGGTISGPITSTLNATFRGNSASSFPTIVHSNGTYAYGFSVATNTKTTRLQGIANPVYGGDAANKDYVDANSGSLTPVVGTTPIRGIITQNSAAFRYSVATNIKAIIFSCLIYDDNSVPETAISLLVNAGQNIPFIWSPGNPNYLAYINLNNSGDVEITFLNGQDNFQISGVIQGIR